MKTLSLTQKLVIATVLGALAVGSIAAGVLQWVARDDVRALAPVAEQLAREQLQRDLDGRAATIARFAAETLREPLSRNADRETLGRLLQPLLAESTLVALSVRDAGGAIVFEYAARSDGGAPTVFATADQAIRQMVPAFATTTVPSTVGTVNVELAAAPLAADAGVAARLRSEQRAQTLQLWWVVGGLSLATLLGGLGIAWWIRRRVARPLDLLARSAERFSQGDYSRPVDVHTDAALGDLEGTLERMRQRLRQTTISRGYLNNVLGSMTDAVFVTSPDGVIRLANTAACKLLSYGEEELIGRSIVSILDEGERAGFDLLQAAQDTRETMVRTRQGQTIPVSLTGSTITNDDPQYQGIIFVARNITERKRAERRIRYLARYDALTKVPNRMQFQHLLQQALARSAKNGTAVALLYLDLDRFKEVNDTFGHAAGDRTLEVLSERLTRAVPKEAVIGRLAGDEFALFLDGLPIEADNRGPIAHLARAILDEVSKSFQLNQQEVFVTASLGIALSPRDAENVIDLIRNADAAMYYSKQNGGNTFAFYSPEMNAAAVDRLMLKNKLRRALERDELLVCYQPKVDIRSGRIVGAEALLRWRLPGRGDIPPSQFIPLAEETNLILDIGEWVLNRVCMDYRGLLEDVKSPGRISLNLSLKQLRQASFILRCRAVFRRHAVSPTAFELEITETTLMVDTKRTLRLLDELYAMGLHLSIDDFGTGYSSLSALQQFPIDTLKIDQSFVRDVGDDESDATIVRTIMEMGRSLGMDVVAEGVESQRQLEFLLAHNCHYAQGRLFGEPCSAEQLKVLLSQQESAGPPFASIVAAARQAREAVQGRRA